MDELDGGALTKSPFYCTRPWYVFFGVFFAVEAVVDRSWGWRVLDVGMVALNAYWFVRADRDL